MTIETALLILRPGARWTVRGGTYDGLVWLDESAPPTRAEVEAMMAQPEPVPVPQEISLRQFLMAADRSGILATLEALKTNEALPSQTKRDIHFFLEYSNFIERHHPLIAQLAPVISVDGKPITEAQIDDLFRAAAIL